MSDVERGSTAIPLLADERLIRDGEDCVRTFEKFLDDAREKIIPMARGLLAARRKYPSNQAFGTWFSNSPYSIFNAEDRAALINIGEHETYIAPLLKDTTATTPQHIWRAYGPTVKQLVFVSETKTTATPPLSIAAPVQPEHVAAPVEAAKPRKGLAGCRIKCPAGKALVDVVREGIELQKESGLTPEKAAKQVGLSLHAFNNIRDIVLLLERNDLNVKDIETVREALRLVIETRILTRSMEMIKPISDRVWGSKGNRLKADKRRTHQFENAIDVVLSTCENAIDIEIPYITTAQANSAIKKMDDAEGAILKLKKRIKEEALK